MTKLTKAQEKKLREKYDEVAEQNADFIMEGVCHGCEICKNYVKTK